MSIALMGEFYPPAAGRQWALLAAPGCLYHFWVISALRMSQPAYFTPNPSSSVLAIKDS